MKNLLKSLYGASRGLRMGIIFFVERRISNE